MKATTFAMAPALVQKLLDSVIYEAIIEMVDFEALHRLEELLVIGILELGQVAPAKGIAVANMMIDRALHQLARDPRRYAHAQPAEDVDCELCAAQGASSAS